MIKVQSLASRKLTLIDTDLCVGCQCCMFACARRFGNAGLEKSAIRIRSAGGMERGFVVVACRACPDPPCMKACPTRALTLRNGGGVILDQAKCIGCGSCAKACTIGAVSWDNSTNKPIICVHCGFCTDFCHYGVIKIRPSEEWERDR